MTKSDNSASINPFDELYKKELNKKLFDEVISSDGTEASAEKIKKLIEAGAEVGKQDSEAKETPLHRAVLLGNERVVKTLIENGARIDAIDEFGMTPVTIAEKFNDKTLKLLKDEEEWQQKWNGTYKGDVPKTEFKEKWENFEGDYKPSTRDPFSSRSIAAAKMAFKTDPAPSREETVVKKTTAKSTVSTKIAKKETPTITPVEPESEENDEKISLLGNTLRSDATPTETHIPAETKKEENILFTLVKKTGEFFGLTKEDEVPLLGNASKSDDPAAEVKSPAKTAEKEKAPTERSSLLGSYQEMSDDHESVTDKINESDREELKKITSKLGQSSTSASEGNRRALPQIKQARQH